MGSERVDVEHRPPDGAWFLAWLGIGATWALVVISMLSIGVFFLPVAIALTVLVGRRPHARSGASGLVSGLGLPLLYVAFLNRDGPGMVCTTSATSVSCEDQWSPWPWLLAGLAFVVLGAIAFRARPRR